MTRGVIRLAALLLCGAALLLAPLYWVAVWAARGSIWLRSEVADGTIEGNADGTPD